MNRAAVQVLIWAVYLTVLTVILVIWWGKWLPVAALGGAALVTALIASGFTLAHRGRPLDDARTIPDISMGSVVVAIGLCGMLYGAEFGFFLVLICAGVLVLGVARLAVELRDERRRREDL